MSTHSLFSPSSSARWIACPGSVAFPENQEQGGSSKFADDGTASHEWAALCLQSPANIDAARLIGSVKKINGNTFTMDEERAEYIQVYLDDVRRRALGGVLFTEYHVDLSKTLGEGQGGTTDAGIYQPLTKNLIAEDLKYGQGEKVYASYDGEINPQLGLYLLGLLEDVELMGYDVETVTGVICQPRVGVIDEHTITVEELRAFGLKATKAVISAATTPPELNPGTKQCRWCRAKTKCPALAEFVQKEVACDFDTVQAEAAPIAPRDTSKLATALLAVPLIEDWCRAVRSEVARLVGEGTEIIGPDNKPYKFVQGEEGKRKWTDELAAEAALLGVLGQKAYSAPKLLTAPAAAKLLDKKATAATWTDVFKPLIDRDKGKPMLALGSDPRPPYSGAASAEDFDNAQE